ncbi:iron ABC transporter permease [Pseudothauera nasutitermitis]|uniref:Iron ABC transporter permease n=1 Tax=Pseudothauera nasutitermitis TaxID=2565930 RepID=A0A4S4AQG9_9RHOO|nr:iron ABC transporter permease [Pseudothauera nasutitermitis]THF61512.1 iron ABC transporter permease [Pseudothauera nasutitermitis]
MGARSFIAFTAPTQSASPARWRFIMVGALLLAALAALLGLSLLLGAVPLEARQIWLALSGEGDATIHALLWNLRLPRSLLAVVVGLHFALSGLILQAVIRNPLADPGVIGVSSGASLAIVAFLLLADFINASLGHDGGRLLTLAGLPFAALLGGLGSALLVLALSWRAAISPVRLALNGVAVGAVLNALVMWIVVAWGGARTEITVIWLAGSLYGRDFDHLALLLPWSALGLAGAWLLLRPLSLLRFDDDVARGLGLHLLRWRLVALVVAVLLAASAIAVAGPIGFVGLVIPHLARLLVGSELRRLLPVSALCGAVLTLGADTVARTAIQPLELPVGVLTTLLGIPVFLILLQRHAGKTA